jgi:predicted dehydrogenase
MAAETTRYRVGIIGTGRIASSIQDEVERAPGSQLLPYSHAGAYAEVPATRIVAAADTNPERLAEFGRRWGVAATYGDYREMLRRESMDIVSICTPTRSHLEVALAVAEAGVRGVFMEKPLAQSLADADRIMAAFDARGIRSAVNHTRTYDPSYRRIRELIAEGAIGSPKTVMAHWHEGMLFGGTHLFDLLRFLIGAEAEWVFGQLDPGDGTFDPGGAGLVRFRDGTDVLINSRVGHAAPIELDVVGTAGRIRVGSRVPPELYTFAEVGGGKEWVKRGFPGSVYARSAMTVAVDELIRAIETGAKPGSDLRDSRADLELAVAWHESSRQARPVQLPVATLDYVIEDPWGRS